MECVSARGVPGGYGSPDTYMERLIQNVIGLIQSNHKESKDRFSAVEIHVTRRCSALEMQLEEWERRLSGQLEAMMKLNRSPSDGLEKKISERKMDRLESKFDEWLSHQASVPVDKKIDKLEKKFDDWLSQHVQKFDEWLSRQGNAPLDKKIDQLLANMNYESKQGATSSLVVAPRTLNGPNTPTMDIDRLLSQQSNLMAKMDVMMTKMHGDPNGPEEIKARESDEYHLDSNRSGNRLHEFLVEAQKQQESFLNNLSARLPDRETTPRIADEKAWAAPAQSFDPSAQPVVSEVVSPGMCHGFSLALDLDVEVDPLPRGDDEDRDALKVDGAFGAIFATGLEPALDQPHYRVEHYYKKHGWPQAFARSERFANLTLVVISLNAIYLGVDADWNTSNSLYHSAWPFIVADNLFCTFFTAELVVRYMAFQHKKDVFMDGWFRFDAVMVLLMIFETWVMGPVLAYVERDSVQIPVEPMRLLRLLRLTRMARLMRSFPELVTLVRGMLIGSRAVLSALAMVAIMIYVFAIILNSLLKNQAVNDKIYKSVGLQFESITDCMWTLTVAGTLMLDGAGVVLTELVFWPNVACRVATLVILIFILLSSITVLNMLIGILCEVVAQLTRSERDEAAIKLVKDSILLDLLKFDDGDGMISSTELRQVIYDPESKRTLKSLDVDQLFLLMLLKNAYKEKDAKLSIRAIMEMMIMCRGDHHVSIKAFAGGLSYLANEMAAVEQKLNQVIQIVTHTQI